MNRYFSLVLLLLLAVVSCKDKKPKEITDADLTAADFIALAAELPYPVLVNDSVINRKEEDSLLINQETYKTFLPDTVYQQFYPKTKGLKLYLLGKVKDGEKGNYVLVKSIQGKNKGVQLLYFDKKAAYLGSMNVTALLPKGTGVRYCRIDSKNNISFIQERKTGTGELWTNETIYFMDEKGKFIVAMTNSTEDLSDLIMGNPIDSLPHTQKYSADYSIDKKNLVSIRDGKTEKEFEFFIHFSKQNGECVGEVKGTGEWIAKNKGIFRDASSDCIINFDFGTSSVRITEQNCGLYRGITCFFEGSYPKKAEPAKKKKKK